MRQVIDIDAEYLGNRRDMGAIFRLELAAGRRRLDHRLDAAGTHGFEFLAADVGADRDVVGERAKFIGRHGAREIFHEESGELSNRSVVTLTTCGMLTAQESRRFTAMNTAQLGIPSLLHCYPPLHLAAWPFQGLCP